MVDLQNKSDEFQRLYAISNPLQGARAKVPLLEVTKSITTPTAATTSGNEKDEKAADRTSTTTTTTDLICESLVVSEYISEEFCNNNNDRNDDSTSSLMPSNANDRATVRLFTELCGSSFSSYFAILRAKTDGERSLAIQDLQDGLQKVDTFLKHYQTKHSSSNNNDNGPFLFGNQFTLAECNAAPFVQRACTILPAMIDNVYDNLIADPIQICQKHQLETLQRWIKAVLHRPSVIETGVPKDTLIERTKDMLKRFETTQASAASAPTQRKGQ